MKSFISFAKKEFLESFRTYKLQIILVVFLLFGIMSPVFAKYMPEILKMAGLDPNALGLGEPSVFDSFAQFFKNVGQMGILVIVIVFCGVIAGELSKGTLINVLTKGLKRSAVILSKWTVSVLLWSFAYLLSLFVTLAYSAYFFKLSGLSNVFLSFFTLWLYGVLLITLLIFGGVVFKNLVGALLTTGGFVVIFSLINIIPTVQKYNPMSLASENMSLLTATKNISDILPAILICTSIIFILLYLSVIIFNKKQM